MKVFYAPQTEAHAPRFFLKRGLVAANEERPERATRLLAAMDRLGLPATEPPLAKNERLLAVHTARYLSFLDGAHEEWQRLPDAGEEVVANVQPRGPQTSYPDSVIGRAGVHMADLACPIGLDTARAARRSADCALAAADALAAGERTAYALCRPPGHHAAAEIAGGHCYLNNAALAAEALAAKGARPAILDIDVHHGNGTQAIFYDRGDILTVSIHTDPANFYPFFTGRTEETGVGAGEGANRNLPLSLGAGDAPWLEAIDAGLETVHAFGPDVVVLALGLDVSAEDPLGGMTVSTEGIARAGARIGALAQNVLVTQEGGYLGPALTDNAAAFFAAFLEARA